MSRENAEYHVEWFREAVSARQKAFYHLKKARDPHAKDRRYDLVREARRNVTSVRKKLWKALRAEGISNPVPSSADIARQVCREARQRWLRAQVRR